ncbi:hypothetical protein BRPE64_ECDS03150 (plasmid) [Caballeronia insecticola]|uniref:Uncharacterized protein n=1 Tax=Caballeronia insecticola TaxID=758793 RepID=A0A060PHF1_9BURK|nr:hypothetical protein BRPE64_ECDS03150 [Caballeronia insecticola]
MRNSHLTIGRTESVDRIRFFSILASALVRVLVMRARQSRALVFDPAPSREVEFRSCAEI